MLLVLVANTVALWQSAKSGATSAYEYYSGYSDAKAWERAGAKKGDQVAYNEAPVLL